TAKRVDIKGINWYFPLSQKSLILAGSASLNPIRNRIAANVAMGILLSNMGMDKAHIKSRQPWTTVDNFDLAPADILAVDLTTTVVMGKPPKRPLTMFPIP